MRPSAQEDWEASGDGSPEVETSAASLGRRSHATQTEDRREELEQCPHGVAPVALQETAAAAATAAPVPQPQAQAPSQPQWQHWQHEIHENVLQNLLGNINPGLAQQVEEHLSVAVMQLSDQITLQVRLSLEEALRETVARAVAEEMEKFKA